MDLFEKNMEYLKENNSGMYKRVNDNKLELENYYIEPLGQSLSNVICKDSESSISMYDKLNTADEIEEMINRAKDKRNIIFYGLGLGYHVFELMKLKNIIKIIVIEPDIRNLLIFMNFYDLDEFSNNPKIELLVTEDEREICDSIASYYQNIFYDKIEVESFYFYQKKYKDQYKRFLEKLIIEYSGQVSSRNTALVANQQFIRNGLYNYINYIEKSFMLDSLFDRYKGIPAIIVGAGPSLSNQLHQLRTVKDKAVIFAVGSGMNVVDKNSIAHHFKVALDPSSGRGEALFFKELKDKSVDLIYMPSVHKDALKDYEGNKFYTKAKVQPEYNYIEKVLDLEHKSLYGGGTISMITVDIARRLGCDPIILLGQDFSYKASQNYADGAVNKKTIKENGQEFFIKEDIYGDEVLTDSSLYALKVAFDDFSHRRIKNWTTKVYNCTEGGLGIEGIENAKFGDILDKYCKTSIKDLSSYSKNSLEKIKVNKGKNQVWTDFHKNIEEVNEKIQSVLDIIDDMEQSLKYEQNDIKIKEYNDKLKSKLKELEDYDVFEEWIMLLTEARLTVIDSIYEKEYALEEDVWEQQKQLVMMMEMQYTQIQFMIKYILEVLDEIFKEKDGINNI